MTVEHMHITEVAAMLTTSSCLNKIGGKVAVFDQRSFHNWSWTFQIRKTLRLIERLERLCCKVDKELFPKVVSLSKDQYISMRSARFGKQRYMCPSEDYRDSA